MLANCRHSACGILTIPHELQNTHSWIEEHDRSLEDLALHMLKTINLRLLRDHILEAGLLLLQQPCTGQ